MFFTLVFVLLIYHKKLHLFEREAYFMYNASPLTVKSWWVFNLYTIMNLSEIILVLLLVNNPQQAMHKQLTALSFNNIGRQKDLYTYKNSFGDIVQVEARSTVYSLRITLRKERSEINLRNALSKRFPFAGQNKWRVAVTPTKIVKLSNERGTLVLIID